MFAPYPHGETVSILTQGATGVDPATNNSLYGTTATTVVEGCAVSPRTEEEITGNGRLGVVRGLNAYMPAGTVVTATDLVEINGVTYRIDGDPAYWKNPYTGRRPGVVLALTRVEG